LGRLVGMMGLWELVRVRMLWLGGSLALGRAW
jgi:hypothetical protein